MSESTEIEETKKVAEDSSESKRPAKTKKPASPARAVGGLVGATVSLPTAAMTFLVAATAGVPAGTAVTRAVMAGAALGIFASLGVRLLFGFVLRDMRRRRAAEASGELQG